MVEVRRVGAEEWEVIRSVRLQALQDAPLYFWATYEDEASLPEGSWRERFMSGGPWFMAFDDDDDDPVGLAAAATWDDLPPGVHQVISMWVRSEARGRGVGRRLIEAVIGWARDQGLHALQLEVTEGNEPAARLYERCGFRFTGRTQPHPREPDLVEREMTLVL